MPIIKPERLQEAFQFKDEFGTEMYGEEDSEEGFMIFIDGYISNGNGGSTCHLPKEEALILARFILNTLEPEEFPEEEIIEEQARQEYEKEQFKQSMEESYDDDDCDNFDND